MRQIIQAPLNITYNVGTLISITSNGSILVLHCQKTFVGLWFYAMVNAYKYYRSFIYRELFASGFETSMSWSANFVTTYLVNFLVNFIIKLCFCHGACTDLCLVKYCSILLFHAMYIVNICSYSMPVPLRAVKLLQLICYSNYNCSIINVFLYKV